MPTDGAKSLGADEILNLWRDCKGDSDDERALKFTRAIEDAVVSRLPSVNPTGEQLYMMVTCRFKSGSLPWSMVSESGKSAWSAAAADLLLSPDTILARYFAGIVPNPDAPTQNPQAL